MKKYVESKTRKIVTCLLALCMIVSMIPFAAIGVSAEAETLATVDPISISDLGLGVSSLLPAGDVIQYFTPADQQGRSAIVKFDVDFTGQVIYLGFYGWEKYALIASDAIHFQTANGQYLSAYRTIKNGRHSVEFGKLEVLAGANVGKDCMYVKFDGELIHTFYTDAFVGRPISYVWLYTSGVKVHDNITRTTAGETLATVSPVSVSDLGLGATYDLAAGGNGLMQNYTPAEQRSAVVKFDVDFKGDIRVGLTAWRECAWISSDCVRLENGLGGWLESYQPIANGRHSVEFGKLAVLTGANAGKDYMYVKLDGAVVLSYYTDAYVATPITYVWFYTGNNGVVLYDSISETLAEVTPVSISNLGMGMVYDLAAGGNGLIQNYTPADQRSSVVTFDVDFNGDIRFGFQAWTECVWIAADCVRLKSGSGGWLESYQPVSNGRHSVELGKLAVLTGENAGKDYFYIKLDGELVLSEYTEAYVNTPITYVWFFDGIADTTLYENIKPAPVNLSVATQRKGNDARLIVMLTDDEATIEAYDNIQIDFAVDGVEYSVGMDSVYDSFYNENRLVTAKSLGATYVAVLEIGNVIGASNITVTASYIANGMTVSGPTRTTSAERIYGSWK